MMTRIERYIFGTALTAFLSILIGLTGVIWITQALRELDLITGKGQTFVIFLVVTGLSLPALVTIIAPVALFIAAIYTLNKLNGDSEWVVAAAAGMSPARLMRPFAALGGIVALVVAINTIWLMPASFAELRGLITQIRADFISNLVREGEFTELDQGITFSYRDRAGGALLGVFLQDRRDPQRTGGLHRRARRHRGSRQRQLSHSRAKGQRLSPAGGARRRIDRDVRALTRSISPPSGRSREPCSTSRGSNRPRRCSPRIRTIH